jgi:hypothetical protein
VTGGVVTGGVVTGGVVTAGAVTGALTGRDAQTSTATFPVLITERDLPEQVTDTFDYHSN